MLERCGYRTALYLSALIAAVNWSFLIYLRWYLPHLDNDIAIYAVAAVVILIGLWLMSRIARYAGAAFYFLSAGVVAFALWGFAKPVHIGVVWAAIMAVLTLNFFFFFFFFLGLCRCPVGLCQAGARRCRVGRYHGGPYKIDFGPGYRVYFGRDGDTIVILLTGGTKKRQQRDIDTAKAYWRDYRLSKRGRR